MSDSDLFSAKTDTAKRHIYSVIELNRKARNLLEMHLSLIWVEGEISNLSQPSSGHWYFTLKDEQAQIRCAMFKGRNSRVKFSPKNGDRIQVRGKISLYEGRGDFQLIAEHISEAGFGLLQKRYEELKQKLSDNGLFDQEHKQVLPHFPQRIAIVTSPTGAAIRDMISVLERRSPSTEITIVPSLVQGEDAPNQLIKATTLADSSQLFDVIIISRGGGSIEDLWAFNSEKLAECLFNCKTPIISAVGHEIDFTITDFVADVRAPTPSAAAEILVPNSTELMGRLEYYKQQLFQLMLNKIQRQRDKIKYLSALIRHPGDTINQWHQQFDQLDIRLRNAMHYSIHSHQSKLKSQHDRLRLSNPQNIINTLNTTLIQQRPRLHKAIERYLENHKKRIAHAANNLDIVSPLATLKRGYAIAENEKGHIIRKPKDVREGEKINLKISEGNITAIVEFNYNK